MSDYAAIVLQDQTQHEIELGLYWARGTIQGFANHGICVEPTSVGQRLLFDIGLYPTRESAQYRDDDLRTTRMKSADLAHYYFPRVQMALLQSDSPFPDLIVVPGGQDVSAQTGILLSRGFVECWEKHWIGTEGEPCEPPLQSNEIPNRYIRTWRNLEIVPCFQQMRLAGPSVGPDERRIFHRKSWVETTWFWLCHSPEPFCLLDADWVNSSGQAHMVFHPQGACFFP